MANTLNLSADQGQYYELSLQVKDTAGLPIDITGWTFTGQVRKSTGDQLLLAPFDFVVDSDQVLNKGKFKTSISAANMTALPIPAQKSPVRQVVVYAYDWFVTMSLGQPLRLAEGTFTVSPKVTV